MRICVCCYHIRLQTGCFLTDSSGPIKLEHLNQSWERGAPAPCVYKQSWSSVLPEGNNDCQSRTASLQKKSPEWTAGDVIFFMNNYSRILYHLSTCSSL